MNRFAVIKVPSVDLGTPLSSVVGSILSNLCKTFHGNASKYFTDPGLPIQTSVLVLGMCFFAGGTRFSEQGFGASK